MQWPPLVATVVIRRLRSSTKAGGWCRSAEDGTEKEGEREKDPLEVDRLVFSGRGRREVVLRRRGWPLVPPELGKTRSDGGE